jgi:UDP-N-acetylglucosamine acyltransferase
VRSLNLVGLKRAGLSPDEIAGLKKAFRILYRSGLTVTQALPQLSELGDSEHLQHLRQFLQLSQMEGRRGLTPGKQIKDKDEG